jgi:hypothetical protein
LILAWTALIREWCARRGKRNRLSVDVQLDGEASAPDFVEQCIEAVEARLRHELGFVPVAAHGGAESPED